MMRTCLLVANLALLAQCRLLPAPMTQKESEIPVSLSESRLIVLVDQPTVSFTKETNLTDSRFKSGEPLNFYCEAVGTPMVNVYWTLNGRIVQGQRRHPNLENIHNEGKEMIGQNVVGSRLELDCVDERLTGTLSCVADNGYEITKKSILIATTGSTVCPRMRPVRPQIGAWTKSRIEEIGNSVVFQCRKAAAGIKIRWENEEGEPLKISDGFETKPNGDLFIASVQWKHLGSYFCVASNEYGETRTETFVFPADKNAPSPAEGEDGEFEDEDEY